MQFVRFTNRHHLTPLSPPRVQMQRLRVSLWKKLPVIDHPRSNCISIAPTTEAASPTVVGVSTLHTQRTRAEPASYRPGSKEASVRVDRRSRSANSPCVGNPSSRRLGLRLKAKQAGHAIVERALDLAPAGKPCKCPLQVHAQVWLQVT